jgi:hypothetical protein
VESAKIAIFLLFFVAFIIVTRKLFSHEKPVNDLGFSSPPLPDSWQAHPDTKQPAAIGSELPFPVEVPPIRQLPNGRYNRPYVLNYYFSNLDLKRGPENPRSFCDQLFVQFEAPETGARWTNEYIVGTPFGLQELLDQTGQNLSFQGTVIVVPRWDMAKILSTVVDDVMEYYAQPDSEESKSSM